MKTKSVFFCSECGNESPKWAGRCGACGAWNSMVEQAEKSIKGSKKSVVAKSVKACRITEIDASNEIRFPTGMGELDRVLGGGVRSRILWSAGLYCGLRTDPAGVPQKQKNQL
jgi:DNA repair protein RadA/Sms